MELIKATEIKAKGNWNYSPLDSTLLSMINSGSWLFNYEIDIDRLKKSLADVLSDYAIFCGTMSGHNHIECTYMGVQFETEEQQSANCDELMTSWKIPSRYKPVFKIKDFKAGKCAPMSIKVVRLSDGVLLSIAVSHVCADGATLYNFVNDWASVYRGETILKPVIDQKLLPPILHTTKELHSILIEKKWHKVGFGNFIIFMKSLLSRKMSDKEPVIINKDQIDEIKNRCFENNEGKISDNSVICAIITKMLSEEEKGWNTKYAVVFSIVTNVDIRGKSMIPDKFVGNAVITLPVENINTNAGTSGIAIKYSEGLRSICNENELNERLQLQLESIRHKVAFVPFDLKGNSSKRPVCIMFNNFSKFPVYCAKFGDAAPIRVFPNDLPDTIKIWPASPLENGVLVFVKGNIAKLI